MMRSMKKPVNRRLYSRLLHKASANTKNSPALGHERERTRKLEAQRRRMHCTTGSASAYPLLWNQKRALSFRFIVRLYRKTASHFSGRTQALANKIPSLSQSIPGGLRLTSPRTRADCGHATRRKSQLILPDRRWWRAPCRARHPRSAALFRARSCPSGSWAAA